MCGIVGYTGMRSAAEVLMNGLTTLEYRGYDSAGITVIENAAVRTVKTKGRLADLAEKLDSQGIPDGHVGIGHTRWATHGAPSDANSHPHCTQRLALVHNGIIENYREIGARLEAGGYRFQSQTDTEAAAALIDSLYDGDALQAMRATFAQMEGSWALGVLFYDQPDRIYAARKDSPLIVGLGDGENFIASDVPAILEYTRDYYLLEEGEIAELAAQQVTVYDTENRPLQKKRMTANWNVQQAQKSGYPHFMLKEIYEQPKVLYDTLHPRLAAGLPNFADEGLPDGFFGRYGRIYIVACGTAMHAGIVGKSLIEQFARIPVEVAVASEFRYCNPILSDDCLVLLVSQSGETADTLAALRLAKSRGSDTLALVNVVGSSIAREADYLLHTYAGPEISVASTKAFSVQVGMMYLLAFAFAQQKGLLSAPEAAQLCAELLDTVQHTKQVLEYDPQIAALAPEFLHTQSLFYLGRGIDHSLAMEGSLKLKEISYIHSEAYAAGELKHGTISLVTEGVPLVALATQSALLPKMISNIRETKARGGYIVLIAQEGAALEADLYDHLIVLPKGGDAFMPLLAAIVLQLFAYHVAVARGCDVDKPRNLAKSVTVE